MTTFALPFPDRRLACYYRPLILAVATAALLGIFWFASRYPQLMSKAQHVGQVVPSMAYSHEVLHAAADAPAWQRILFGMVNWLDTMKVGMTFGVLFGALLHTLLRYYPLKIGGSLYLNSVKGALVGMPMGVCANCAVPAACGVTRGHGRVEVALGFLFSSPNFNPVVQPSFAFSERGDDLAYHLMCRPEGSGVLWAMRRGVGSRMLLVRMFRLWMFARALARRKRQRGGKAHRQ